MSTCAKENRNIYALVDNRGFIWLSTLRTNRKDAWEYGLKYATREQLKRDGYKCVRYHLTQPEKAEAPDRSQGQWLRVRYGIKRQS